MRNDVEKPGGLPAPHAVLANSHAVAAGAQLSETVKLGLTATYNADYERAVHLYSEALRIDSNDARTYALRGDAFRLLCDHSRARADFGAAIRLDPSDASLHIRRAHVHRQREREILRIPIIVRIPIYDRHGS